ncbi:hypothetical protein OJ40_06585 [Salmonella enterica subsp. enterica]|uniref:hypothetical protein n=1 Tax=Salmonella enterica TaxID=28901 RepID=UPI0009EAFE54|nr:hypothetical protein [Salmonella enterica]EBP3538321.1 hypothetical protein [Salmonella enterica subsp. enterica]EBQ5244709.1 hypothetical protein [Salmonella enterica subsp. salamae]EDM1754384.1 hypothetical protein [Salmonella enterica subsp. diarizonae]
MWAITLKLLKSNWKSLLLIVVLAGGGVWLGTCMTQSQLRDQALAFSNEKSTLISGFNTQKSQWDQERISAANQYASNLKDALMAQQAWQRKADELSRQLAAQEVSHQRAVKDLKERLKNAIKSDGNTYTGIGPASLQLWREALGYPAAQTVHAGHHLPETTGGAAGDTGDANSAGGGLSPSGIVRHSAEYGKWCLSLRDRLQAINDYYR